MKHFILAVLAILLTGCPDTVDPPPERPPGVTFVPYGGPGQITETGVRPKAGSQNSIILEWTSVGEYPFIDRYEIYRATSIQDTFWFRKSIAGDELPITEDDSVNVGQTYYYYVIAVNDQKAKSDTTNYFKNADSIAHYVYSFTLGPKVSLLGSPSPLDTVVTTKPLFVWCSGVATPVTYVVRLAVGGDPSTIWIAEVPPTFFDLDCSGFDNQEKLRFHDSTYVSGVDSLLATANNVTIDKGSNAYKNSRLTKSAYLWRVDAVFGNNHVSHSQWQPFLINRDY